MEEYVPFLPFAPRLDQSNLDVTIPRNRIRHRLLPLLEEEYNPSVRRVLLSEAETLASIAEIVNALTAEAGEEDVTRGVGGTEIDVSGLSSRPLAIRRELIAGSLREMGLEPDFDLVEDIREKLLDVSGNARLDLSPELSARRVYDRIIMGPRPPEETFPEFNIDGEGLYPLPRAGLRLQVRLMPYGGEDPRAAVPDASTAWLDADKLSFPLRVRGVRPGDRFHPLGSPGKRKLQDFLVDAKVPREERSMVAVVESAGEIAWVMGMRIDERFKVHENTVEVAVLHVVG